MLALERSCHQVYALVSWPVKHHSGVARHTRRSACRPEQGLFLSSDVLDAKNNSMDRRVLTLSQRKPIASGPWRIANHCYLGQERDSLSYFLGGPSDKRFGHLHRHQLVCVCVCVCVCGGGVCGGGGGGYGVARFGGYLCASLCLEWVGCWYV